ncbi:MAG TPA: hypothetical protein DCG49_03245 [Ruminococcus sp.]|nr:hypothetical protein [Ruminococcus sp.]
MKIKYINCNPMRVRNLQMKLFTPDTDSFRKYVIALHGFAGSMESWAITALADKLTEEDTAVIAFNYPGHGTDEQDELFSLGNCIRDFQDVMEYMNIRLPDAVWQGIFATSFGGYITLNSLQLIPESVRIVLRAPAVNMQDVFARIVERETSGMTEYKETGHVQLGYERKLKVPYSFYTELCSHDVFRTDHKRPMLLIHGDCDDVVLPQDTIAFCERNPQIVRKTIAGADHLFRKEGELPQVITAAVDWLMK